VTPKRTRIPIPSAYEVTFEVYRGFAKQFLRTLRHADGALLGGPFSRPPNRYTKRATILSHVFCGGLQPASAREGCSQVWHCLGKGKCQTKEYEKIYGLGLGLPFSFFSVNSLHTEKEDHSKNPLAAIAAMHTLLLS
jgi:hypothetical protein